MTTKNNDSQTPATAGSDLAVTNASVPAVPIDLKASAKIIGEESMIATVQLTPGQVLRAESGSMLYMTEGVQMETSLQGASSAFSRMLTGQNMFLTDFTYTGNSKGTVGLGTDFPSKILRLDLQDFADSSIICQKGAFLASNPTVDISIEATKNFKAGFFGGEGFILQKLSGTGDVLVKGGGTIVNKTLQEGETLRVTSGSLVAFESSVAYDVQMMPGIKNAMFGGEGLFVTTLQGPGQIWLQGMPPDRMIAEIARRVPGPGIGLGVPLFGGGGGGGTVDGGEGADGTGGDGADGTEATAASDAAIDADRQATVATSSVGDDPAVGNSGELDSESPSALFGDAAGGQDASNIGNATPPLDQDSSSDFTEGLSDDPFGSNSSSGSSNMSDDATTPTFDDGGSDFFSDATEAPPDGELFDDRSSVSTDGDGGDDGGGILSTLWDLFTDDD